MYSQEISSVLFYQKKRATLLCDPCSALPFNILSMYSPLSLSPLVNTKTLLDTDSQCKHVFPTETYFFKLFICDWTKYVRLIKYFHVNTNWCQSSLLKQKIKIILNQGVYEQAKSNRQQSGGLTDQCRHWSPFKKLFEATMWLLYSQWT